MNVETVNGSSMTKTFPLIVRMKDADLYDRQYANMSHIVDAVKDQSFMPYIKMALDAMANGDKAPINSVTEVYEKHVAHMRTLLSGDDLTTYLEKFDETWEQVMRQQFINSPTMVTYFLDKKGYESPGLYNAVYMIALSPSKSSAVTLETTYSRVPDITGRYWDVDIKDALSEICAMGAIFREMKWRDFIISMFILHFDSVLSLGCGAFRELRRNSDITLDVLKQKRIVGIDSDPLLMQNGWLDYAFKDRFGVPFSETDIEYINDNFMKVAKDPKFEEQFGLVFTAGTFSYQSKTVDGKLVRDEEACLDLMQTAWQKVRPGGVMIVTDEIAVPDMGLVKLGFGWQGDPPMCPSASIEESLERFSRLAAQLDNAEEVNTMVEPSRRGGSLLIVRKMA